MAIWEGAPCHSAERHFVAVTRLYVRPFSVYGGVVAKIRLVTAIVLCRIRAQGNGMNVLAAARPRTRDRELMLQLMRVKERTVATVA